MSITRRDRELVPHVSVYSFRTPHADNVTIPHAAEAPNFKLNALLVQRARVSHRTTPPAHDEAAPGVETLRCAAEPMLLTLLFLLYVARSRLGISRLGVVH